MASPKRLTRTAKGKHRHRSGTVRPSHPGVKGGISDVRSKILIGSFQIDDDRETPCPIYRGPSTMGLSNRPYHCKVGTSMPSEKRTDFIRHRRAHQGSGAWAWRTDRLSGSGGLAPVMIWLDE